MAFNCFRLYLRIIVLLKYCWDKDVCVKINFVVVKVLSEPFSSHVGEIYYYQQNTNEITIIVTA